MKRTIINIGCLLMVALLTTSSLMAQPKEKKRAAAATVEVKMVILDEEGSPLKDIELITAEGSVSDFTNEKGYVELEAKADGLLLVEGLGYKSVMIDINRDGVPSTLTLEADDLFASEEYTRNRGDQGVTTKHDLVGAIDYVKGADLATFADYSISNALDGRLSGVTVVQSVNGLANNVSDIYVRGLSAYTDNTALVIIDGMERDMDDIVAEEIETIEVMKDATAKIIYGARAANGVIVITSKRGAANKRVVNISAEMGIMQATRTPSYLNSYDYATLYNEARVNDGLAPFYSDTALEGYLNSAGPNDLLYPDFDQYNYFLNSTAQYNKVVFDVYGGDQTIKYSMVGSYVNGNGLESVGEEPTLNRINLRGNLDIKVNEFINFYAEAAARLELRKWGSMYCSDAYSLLTTTRPNEYPVTIDPNNLGFAVSDDDSASGTPIFGTSMTDGDNILAQMMYGGYSSERYVTSQTKIGTDVSLNSIAEGLSAGAYVTFDSYTYIKETKTDTYATYAIREVDSTGDVDFLQMQSMSLADESTRSSFTIQRNIAYSANVAYKRAFDMSDFSASLAYHYDLNTQTGDSQNMENDNLSLRLNYGYDSRYLAEGTFALMGSNRYAKGKRTFASYAFGGAWILSNESFMSGAKSVDFLKLKASYGRLGYDATTSWLQYATAWGDYTDFKVGEANGSNDNSTYFIVMPTELDWEYSSEFNIGVEALLFGKRLNLEANYFNEMRSNIVGDQDASQAGLLGSFVTLANNGRVHNTGIEGYISWSERCGDFTYNVGLNAIWSRNKLMEWNDIEYPDAYTTAVGLSTDAMMGYTSLGLFGKDVALEGAPLQTLGDYQEGDIAYADLNNDGVIDSRDMSCVGNTFPRTTLSLNLDLKYKGWGLYLLGTAHLGLDTWLTNSYYQVSGEDKYSTVVLDRWHAENNPDGEYPRLTTTSADNNFAASDFWVEDASFFRLKNMELSYTFNFKGATAPIKRLKLYGRGTNLFVISPIKDLDPEALNAGVTNYPLFRTITGGVSITF